MHPPNGTDTCELVSGRRSPSRFARLARLPLFSPSCRVYSPVPVPTDFLFGRRGCTPSSYSSTLAALSGWQWRSYLRACSRSWGVQVWLSPTPRNLLAGVGGRQILCAACGIKISLILYTLPLTIITHNECILRIGDRCSFAIAFSHCEYGTTSIRSKWHSTAANTSGSSGAFAYSSKQPFGITIRRSGRRDDAHHLAGPDPLRRPIRLSSSIPQTTKTTAPQDCTEEESRKRSRGTARVTIKGKEVLRVGWDAAL